MLSLFRHASRQAPTLTRGLATKSDHALSGVVQEAVDSGKTFYYIVFPDIYSQSILAQHVAPTASRGGGTQVQYVPWPGEYKNRRPFNSVNTAMVRITRLIQKLFSFSSILLHTVLYPQ